MRDRLMCILVNYCDGHILFIVIRAPNGYLNDTLCRCLYIYKQRLCEWAVLSL